MSYDQVMGLRVMETLITITTLFCMLFSYIKLRYKCAQRFARVSEKSITLVDLKYDELNLNPNAYFFE